MLLEIAVADAYGAGFEFRPAQSVAELNQLTDYVPHALYPSIYCRYTDDTQMSIAVAECVLAGTAADGAALADAFVSAFRRDARLGYSKGFYQLLCDCESGEDLRRVLRSESTRNGAAMRSVPLGVLDSAKLVLEAARIQADITHATELGRASSQAVGLSAYFGLHCGGTVAALPKFLAKYQLDCWDYEWREPVSVEAFDTVSAALGMLQRHRSMAKLLINCVALQGDTDSVAAIALGLASCFGEYERDLPEWLFQQLDEPHYGVDFLTSVDAQLLARLK